jgi:succinate-acetate transporter protein
MKQEEKRELTSLAIKYSLLLIVLFTFLFWLITLSLKIENIFIKLIAILALVFNIILITSMMASIIYDIIKEIPGIKGEEK